MFPGSGYLRSEDTPTSEQRYQSQEMFDYGITGKFDYIYIYIYIQDRTKSEYTPF